MSALLMLCDAGVSAGETVPSCVLLGLCVITKKIEPAGRSFLDKYESGGSPLKPRRKKNNAKTKSQTDDDESADRADTWSRNKKKDKGKGGAPCGTSLSSGTHLRRILAYDKTLYEILGVDEGASRDEIKKQYRKKVLEYHPDKAKSNNVASSPPSDALWDAEEGGVTTNGNEKNEAFLKLQEAYEGLSDPDFRRQYDSSLPFDESIPDPADCTDPGLFYANFGAAFNRNARFSSRRPVPTLGNDETPMSAVEEFYTFWFEFESWRDFGVYDEHDVNRADCREERRWMERENAKIRKKYTKCERARIQKLVETARAADPRIRRQKEEEKRRKQEGEEARRRAHEARVRDEEERKKREEEDALRREEDAQKMRKEQQLERQKQRKWRQRFRWLYRALCEEAGIADGPNMIQLQDLSMQLSVAEMVAVCQKVYEVLGLQGPVQDEAGEPCEASEISASDEQRMSVAAIYAEQWRIFLEAKRSKEQATEEELRRLQEEKQRQETHRRRLQEAAWTQNELSMLARALQRFPSGTARRWHQITSFIGTKTQEEVCLKAREMANAVNNPTSMSSRTNQTVERSTTSQNQQPCSPSPETCRNAEEASPSPSPAATAIAGEEAVWTREQQTALEEALAKHPSSMPAAERWSAIANDVPGKTRKECIDRFKQIRAAILRSKAS